MDIINIMSELEIQKKSYYKPLLDYKTTLKLQLLHHGVIFRTAEPRSPRLQCELGDLGSAVRKLPDLQNICLAH